MGKRTGLLFAMALLIPTVVLAAAPAGSATANGPTCKTFRAAVTISPALPRLGVKTVVNAKIISVGRIGGCTGGGVIGAAFTDTYSYKGNCTTFVAGTGVTTPGPSSLLWSNGKSSTASTTAKLVGKVAGTSVALKLTSHLTKGQFAGTTASGTVKATSPAGTCTKTGLGKATLTGTGSFTFKG